MGEVDRMSLIERYRTEKASGGVGADVIDIQAKPMRQVIARCGTFGQARAIVDALNHHRGAVGDNERLLNRLKTLYADLAAPGPIDAERQRMLAELARDALGGQ